ncbi:MAG TPA: NAD(P)-dependent oxidoreductase [Solirubrobacterales bacterium]|nr:NAD(P)-dependent oxidoreductase [Solirubrobacterales bacterium]
MKVFVAGATGAIGKQLVPMLVEGGHEVTGMTRTAAKADLIRSLGARPAVVDALDPEAVAQAVAESEPEIVIHELTAIDLSSFSRSIDKQFAETNRLRTEGLDHLLTAAKAAGARRFIAQSFAGWPYKRVGGPVKSEEDLLDDNPPKPVRESLAAIRHLEGAVTRAEGIEGIALRYGGFYGPGTSLALDPPGEQTQMVRRRRFPIVGNGAGTWSLVHIRDAAAATAAAMDRGDPGVYNVVDDDPAPVAVFLPELAKNIGAKPPRHVPRWLGRLVGGEVAVIMMTTIRGASNAKAKRELGWQLRYPSWRLGFKDGLV